MNKQQVIKLAKEKNVIAEDTSTYGTWAYRFYDANVVNPGRVNVARLVIPGAKDLFWDACAKALNTHF